MSKTLTIAEVEFKINLAEQWFPIVAAAGYANVLRELEPEDGHALAGKIMRDREVNKLRALDAFRVFTEPEYPGVFETNWKALFEVLGEDGRAALRDRINFQPKKI